MKTILVTGAAGQLGKCFRKVADEYPEYRFVWADSSTLDITDRDAVSNFFDEVEPDYCINAAAYTAVDLAETEVDTAYAVNAYGPENLALACSDRSAALIHISTDYVFDGNTRLPYDESDFTFPLGIYGKSKLLGEELASEANSKTIIIRTSWLYSKFNKNFVKTMLNLFAQRKELGIVADQYGQPTNANDLAGAIMQIIRKEPKNFGIFHFSNAPETTWFDFATRIAAFSGSDVKLNKLTTEQYPTPAPSPARSTMSTDKISRMYDIEIKHWENSLESCINDLVYAK